MKGQLTFWDCRHIEEILDDPILVSILLVDGMEKGKHICVSVDGSVRIGRTRYDLLNRFFKDYKVYSFTDFAFKVANALAGQTANRNNKLFHSISQIVLEKAIADNNYQYVVDALFDVFRHGWNGEHKSKFMNVEPEPIASFDKSNTVQQQQVFVGEVRSNSGEVLIEDVTIRIPKYSRR